MTDYEKEYLIKSIIDIEQGKILCQENGNVIMFNRKVFRSDPDFVMNHNKKLARTVASYKTALKNYTRLRAVTLDDLNRSMITYLYEGRLNDEQMELFREIIADAKNDIIDWSEYDEEA